jgi:hypothetical protein
VRDHYDAVIADLLAEPNNYNTVKFARAVCRLDLGRAEAELLKEDWPADVWAYDKRVEVVSKLATADSLGVPVVQKDMQEKGGLHLHSARISLRHQLTLMLRSFRCAPGSFVLLGPAEEAGGAAVRKGGG